MAVTACAAGESFRVSGFQLDGYDGCYEVSSVSTFNFLPIFYLDGGVPADGPTVYASDLFGALSDEVWAIGNYNLRRDVVDARHCYDDDGNNASAVAPPDVTSWNCGDLASTFTVACGCSTPSPAAQETPSPNRSPSVAPIPAESTPPSPVPVSTVAPTVPAESVPPSPAPVATVAPTPVPAASTKPPAAPPAPTQAPSASAGSREVVGGGPSPAPTTPAAGQNTTSPSPSSPSSLSSSSSSSSPMGSQSTTCSGGDPFRVGGFDLGSYDGCYLVSEASTFNFLPVFYLDDGVPADGPTVYASDLSGFLANENFVWAIGNYDSAQDAVDSRECYDAEMTDASTIHPSAVATWTCQSSGEESSSTDASTTPAPFTVACGCATQAPSVAGGVDGRGVSSSAPVSLAAEAVVVSEEESEALQDVSPLVVIISAVLAGMVVIAICLAIAFEGLRKALWICLACKRESKSQDSSLSVSGSSASRLSSRRSEPPVATAAAAAAGSAASPAGAVEQGNDASRVESSGGGGDPTSTVSHNAPQRMKQ